ncbi:helix-turn-helix transcriptional regulator [Thiothrix nivea]|uniref:Prophage CP4-57 regulatory n=1 Tax=Thiothrix nivea (strain ATCC 35100 / DSM 5205 / JP2) TaxID=870187 RepID=A0A656HB81_THINJ|nr:AlpA family phage regulatory protein [Thiothrix nivea]EIJ33553.1 Prophage CP4-57 regulatory [Thiothrix nivea DSM 5205]
MAASTQTTPTTDRALKIGEVRGLVGLGTSRIYELEKAGQFPRRRLFGSRSVRWLQSEIMAYIQSRPAA